jgi:hypothetical protein
MDGVSIGMTVTNVESILRLLQINTVKVDPLLPFHAI